MAPAGTILQDLLSFEGAGVVTSKPMIETLENGW